MAPWWWFPCKPKHVGAVLLILKCFNNYVFKRCVHQLEIKVLNIIDARCNHKDEAQTALFKDPVRTAQ